MANRSSTPGLRQWLAATMFACAMIAATTGHSWHPISSKLEFIGAYPVYPEVDYGSGPQAEVVRRGEYLLLVILGRSIAGHFTPANHFAFQGVTWYWHFVDVVWLLLFVFVYWL